MLSETPSKDPDDTSALDRANGVMPPPAEDPESPSDTVVSPPPPDDDVPSDTERAKGVSGLTPAGMPSEPVPPEPVTIQMHLWEREAMDAVNSEAMRQERIAALVTERAAELAKADARQHTWREKVENRCAAEVRQRNANETEKAAYLERVAEDHARSRADTEEAMRAEQTALRAEGLRQEAAKKAGGAPPARIGHTDDFAYAWEDGMDRAVKLFRQRGARGDTLVLKIDHDRNELQVDWSAKGLALADLAEKLDEYGAVCAPRYVLYLHEHKHADGRATRELGPEAPNPLPRHRAHPASRPASPPSDVAPGRGPAHQHGAVAGLPHISRWCLADGACAEWRDR